jgi:hypothetical protein
MRNYQKGEIALTRVGLFRIIEDVPCGSHWIVAETMPELERCVLREKAIVAVLEVQNEPA